MPRKSGTKEKFVSLNVELSTKQELEKHKLPGEPLYQTAHRMFHKYMESDLEDAEFMINDHLTTIRELRKQIAQLQSQRNTIQTIERYT